MRINEAGRIAAVQQYQKQHEARMGSDKKLPRKDQVQISDAAKELHTTSAYNNKIRSGQIDRIKQEIASGTYHVEAGKIAEKLLPYMRE